jgi:hypothetical protein
MPKEVNLAGTVEKICTLVKSLDTAQRLRVMRAVSALFDDSDIHEEEGEGRLSERRSSEKDVGVLGTLPESAKIWMKRYAVTTDHLEQVFHFEGGKVKVIADTVPGSSKKEQTVNCYVLEGTRAFLETGSPKFTDSDSDALCERIGCRDKTNHAANRSSAGSKFTGSRRDGFTLVSPGLQHAAKMIKEIARPEGDAKQ